MAAGSKPTEDLRAHQEILEISEARRRLDIEHMSMLSKIGKMYGKQADNTEQQNKHIEATSKIHKDLYKTVSGQSDKVLEILKNEGTLLKQEKRILQTAQEANVGRNNQLKGMTKLLDTQVAVHKLVADEADLATRVGEKGWEAFDVAKSRADIEKRIGEIKTK